ncbi:hypothetical protein IQ277_26955 [Nostocales cyanobacterium LEGE 12452]|nr:hypothetical protein [Nostocales cyanobacterium LEGE 12452]
MRKILLKIQLPVFNAQFKFCQPKRDRPEARTIISLWKVMRFIASL